MRDTLRSIVKNIGMPATIELLAEECTELGKSALKTSRIIRNENPTPVTLDESRENLIEEIADVTLCIEMVKDALCIMEHEITRVEEYKVQRMKNRCNTMNSLEVREKFFTEDKPIYGENEEQ